MRAFCFASGHIDFGNAVPAGAKVIARGPAKDLREFIAGAARKMRARTTFGGHHELLLVPGMPEAPNPIAAAGRLDQWCKHIAMSAPKSIRVLPR